MPERSETPPDASEATTGLSSNKVIVDDSLVFDRTGMDADEVIATINAGKVPDKIDKKEAIVPETQENPTKSLDMIRDALAQRAPAAVPDPPPPEPAAKAPDPVPETSAAIEDIENKLTQLTSAMRDIADFVHESQKTEFCDVAVAEPIAGTANWSPFDVLGIPNLREEANRPEFRVEFDLGPAGKHQAWYHWVGEHNGGLFLVYDTRFEYGTKYSPPDMGEQAITIRLPDNNKSYSVYSSDFVHPFGVFEITNLVIADTADSGMIENTLMMTEDPYDAFGE